MRICAIIYMGLKIHATYDIFNLYIIISMFIMCATKYFIMTEKMDFYGIRDIMNETLNEKKAYVPRHGDKESLDSITAQLNEAKMHPCVFLNSHAIGIEAAGDFMKLLNSGEEQYSDNDMVDKDLLKNVYNTLKKIYKDEGKKLKESTIFESVLKENGIEVYPEDGKLKARNIGQQVVSSRTQNKLNPLGTKNVAKPLTPTQKAATSAVLNILNDKGKAGDINSEFDTNPRPDITLMANGDAVITPDGQKNRSYKIPASEIDAHMRESASKLLENHKLNESSVVIASWRRDTAERLIKEANKIDSSYSFVEYDIGPKKEIKYKVFKNDDEYVGTFDVFTDEPYNSPYRFFFNHVNLPNVEFQGMDIDEFDKMFKDFITTDKRLGHRALSESSLKENECSLEQLLANAYVSDYKMGSKNSARVRVRTSPALLTADSMAARFEEDIPDGYELEVEYLGEDPILGRNLDIYEVQLLKN